MKASGHCTNFSVIPNSNCIRRTQLNYYLNNVRLSILKRFLARKFWKVTDCSSKYFRMNFHCYSLQNENYISCFKGYLRQRSHNSKRWDSKPTGKKERFLKLNIHIIGRFWPTFKLFSLLNTQRRSIFQQGSEKKT